MSTTNAAADRLNALIRTNGPDFLRMPSSVKAYLGHELEPFPEERAVLQAAFDAGVHTNVRKKDVGNRELHFREVADKFSKAAGIHPDWARWAVNVWAAALDDRPRAPSQFSGGTPVRDAKSLKAVNDVIDARFDPDPQLKIMRGGASPWWFKLFMTLIVMSGASLGAFVGRSWPIAAIMCGFDIVDSTMGRGEYEKFFPPDDQPRLSAGQKVLAYALFFFFYSSPCAVSAALGSCLGWWFGRADGRPWLGFWASFGAAFGTNTILVLIFGCFVTVFTSFFVCFGASFKVASTTS
jgi:hypothetical protein